MLVTAECTRLANEALYLHIVNKEPGLNLGVWTDVAASVAALYKRGGRVFFMTFKDVEAMAEYEFYLGDGFERIWSSVKHGG